MLVNLSHEQIWHDNKISHDIIGHTLAQQLEAYGLAPLPRAGTGKSRIKMSTLHLFASISNTTAFISFYRSRVHNTELNMPNLT